MNRRETVVALIVFGVAPLNSVAQQQAKAWLIGFLGTASASGYVKEIDTIRAGLRNFGYVEGKDIIIEYRWAESNPERLKEMAAELVALKVDAIITHSTLGGRTAGRATKTIPIVMADSSDPVATGLVASLARPGGNITGSTSFQIEIAAKRLELLKEAVPRLKRVSVLFNALSANNEAYFRSMEATAKLINVELHPFSVRTPEELPGVFAAIAKQRLEATVIGEDPLLNSSVGVIAALAVTHRLPTVGLSTYPDAGGLLGYGANRALLWGQAAYFVDKILKGAKPGDLPIERATKFDLIINLKTAKALGIRFAPQLLQRADRVIE